jgi:tetratricopeptide (TPR) repeat protein
MSTSARRWLALFTLVTAACTGARAQEQPPDDRPTPFVPLQPETRQDHDRRESLKQYVLGLLCQREDRLLEALSAFERAAKLDPQAGPVQQALIPMYLALDRAGSALAATRKALELIPDDHETWYLYARQLRTQGQFAEAAAALRKAVACPSLTDRPDLSHQLYLDLGVLLERTARHAEAAAAYAQAVHFLELTEAPHAHVALRSSEIHERVGRMWVEARQHDKAVAAFRKAQEVCPEGAGRLNLNLAQVCQAQGRHAEALAYVDGYLKLQPQGTEAYELKADLLRRLGRGGEVVPWLEKASAAEEHNLRLRMLLAREHAAAGQGRQAEAIIAAVAAEAPTPEVYTALFRLYASDPKLGMIRTVTLFEKTFRRARDRANPGQRLALAQARAMLLALRDDAKLALALLDAAGFVAAKAELEPETLQTLATLADRAGRFEQAEKFFRGALRGSKGSDEAGKPILYQGLLKVLWKLRKYGEVAEVCREALQTARDAECVLYHSELSRALTRLERFEDALQEADNAIRLASGTDRLGAKMLRVQILIQAGTHDEAEKECLGLLREHVLPGEVLELRYLLSGVYSAARRYAQAEEQLEQCLKLDPDNATLNNDLGYIWADQNKNLERAEELIRKAIELHRGPKRGPLAVPAGAEKDEPENAAYIDSLGWVLYRKGDLAGARRELERAARLPDGDDPVIWDHLGDVYLRLELSGPARTAFERAAHFYERDRRGRMDGRYQAVRQKLKRLGASTHTP